MATKIPTKNPPKAPTESRTETSSKVSAAPSNKLKLGSLKPVAANDLARANALAKLNTPSSDPATKANNVRSDSPTIAAEANATKRGVQHTPSRGTRRGVAPTTSVAKKAAQDIRTVVQASRARKGARVSGTPAKSKRLSALDAAAQVLASLPSKEARAGLGSQELIERMAASGLWTSPGGRTPAATLYAAMSREIAAKGAASRFARLEPGADGQRGRFIASGSSRASAKHGSRSIARTGTRRPEDAKA